MCRSRHLITRVAMMGVAFAVAGCSSDEPQLVSPSAPAIGPAAIDLPAAMPTTGPPGPRIDKRASPVVRIGRPRQALIVDTSPKRGEYEGVTYEELVQACSPSCAAYQRTRLQRQPVKWFGYPVRNGRATIMYGRNQCGGAPTEIVVNGRRVDVYRYIAIDPVEDDHFGIDGCTLALGDCDSDPCVTNRINVDQPDGTRLEHGTLPALRRPVYKSTPAPLAEAARIARN